MKIGVLAVQGAFIEHEHIIEKIGHEVVEIRQRKDLDGIDGIILPGGESTVQGQLLRKLDMLATIKSLICISFYSDRQSSNMYTVVIVNVSG